MFGHSLSGLHIPSFNGSRAQGDYSLAQVSFEDAIDRHFQNGFAVQTLVIAGKMGKVEKASPSLLTEAAKDKRLLEHVRRLARTNADQSDEQITRAAQSNVTTLTGRSGQTSYQSASYV